MTYKGQTLDGMDLPLLNKDIIKYCECGVV